MDPQVFVDYMHRAFQTMVIVALPILGTALIVGVLISVFQTVTSIQEQTLVFVPKMLGVIVALILFFPFIVRTIMSFTVSAFQMIPQVLQ
jgi:flagellar biosynthetic protein FliQ